MRFFAGLQGIDIDKVKGEVKKKNEFLFGDPDDYRKMTAEERENLTKKMKYSHKVWGNKTELSDTRQRG